MHEMPREPFVMDLDGDDRQFPKGRNPPRSPGVMHRSGCSTATWVQDFFWQLSAQTFWLRPRIFLVTKSERGLCRPHLKHDIVAVPLPKTGEPKGEPAFLAV
jgi:hypothetical protein